MKKDGAFMNNLMIFFLLRMGSCIAFYCYLGCCTNPKDKLRIKHDDDWFTQNNKSATRLTFNQDRKCPILL